MEKAKERIKQSKEANKRRQDARIAFPQSIFDIGDLILFLNRVIN